MIEEAKGNLLAAEVDALVNAVNTVGVMGKGLARAFAAYRQACAAGSVTIGAMFVVDRAPASPRWIVNFPTKRHWRARSHLDDIRLGLVDLVAQVERRGIASIAIPALGCGLGGLDWAEVRPMIVGACAAIPTTRVLLFSSR